LCAQILCFHIDIDIHNGSTALQPSTSATGNNFGDAHAARWDAKERCKVAHEIVRVEEILLWKRYAKRDHNLGHCLDFDAGYAAT